MKTYEVKTTFTFAGIFKVRAESKEEARENVKEHCGLSDYATHIEFRTKFNYPILSFRTYVELHNHWYYDA